MLGLYELFSTALLIEFKAESSSPIASKESALRNFIYKTFQIKRVTILMLIKR